LVTKQTFSNIISLYGMDDSKYAAHNAARDGIRESIKPHPHMLIRTVGVVESLLNVSRRARCHP
jgi:hypothetical protein